MIDQLTGPLGGALAGAFAAGAVSGYGFAMKSAVAEARRHITELRERVSKLEQREEELQKQLIDEIRKRSLGVAK